MDRKIKIGIIDDHALFRQGIRMMVESNTQIEVCLEASNGVELLDVLNKEPQLELDAVLLDLEMPQMDGMETCGKVRELYPHLKILILTMHQDPRLIQHMMKQGANGYVLKTAKWEELQKALLQVIEQDYYFSDLVGLAMLNTLKSPGKKPLLK